MGDSVAQYEEEEHDSKQTEVPVEGIGLRIVEEEVVVVAAIVIQHPREHHVYQAVCQYEGEVPERYGQIIQKELNQHEEDVGIVHGQRSPVCASGYR